jgi:hydroxylamine reductase
MSIFDCFKKKNGKVEEVAVAEKVSKMFCFQCQEACKNTGCDKAGMCGKKADTANLQDLLIYSLKGISIVAKAAGLENDEKIGKFITEALFVTVTNTNFDNSRIEKIIEQAFKLRDSIKSENAAKIGDKLHDSATWNGSVSEFATKASEVGVLSIDNEDVRSLRELLIYGVKGMAAYAHHAEVLGKIDTSIYAFEMEALISTTEDLAVDAMIALVLKAGEVGVTTMALLDGANTGTYGNPELTKVNIGVGTNPGILISGHDLKDMDELMKQTEGTGIDIYTHSEMLPAHYYPAFKKYKHLVGNYGNAWYKQDKEFESFNGPILMTTNCIVPPKDSYRDRIFTTGTVGYAGIKHIADREDGKAKDFSEIIELAKKCAAPTEIEKGEIVGGFAHNQVLALADKVVDAVKSGAIKRFVVMGGCDGRHKNRSYFTEVAEQLPKDTIILTAGCAKYRYNKLELGDIGGIPRVLDAGQCNDCYSLAVIALKLKEVFELEDINDLPLSFDIAWYEQKAVIVLLALLHLGVKDIRLGPSLPAFLSPTVVKVLVDTFDIKPTGEVEEDIKNMMAGK